MPKLPVHRLSYIVWAICHPTPVPLSSPVHSDFFLRGGLGWHQAKRERISQIIKEPIEKIAEEERKRKEEESSLLHSLCAPDLISTKLDPPLTNPLVPAPEEKEKSQEK